MSKRLTPEERHAVRRLLQAGPVPPLKVRLEADLVARMLDELDRMDRLLRQVQGLKRELKGALGGAVRADGARGGSGAGPAGVR